MRSVALLVFGPAVDVELTGAFSQSAVFNAESARTLSSNNASIDVGRVDASLLLKFILEEKKNRKWTRTKDENYSIGVQLIVVVFIDVSFRFC